MKNFKTKKIVLGTVMALSAVSLASVGFANWVFNGATGEDSGNIKADVGEVQDKSVSATINKETTELALRFDYLKDFTNVGEHKVIYKNGDNQFEDLEVTVGYTIALSTETTETDVTKICSAVNLKFEMSAEFIKAISDDYIAVEFGTQTSNAYSFDVTIPTVNTGSTDKGVKTEWTIGTDKKSVEAKSTFYFKWGSKFLNHNPCYLLTSEANRETEVKENLKTFVQTYKSNLTGKIVVTPTLRAA